MKQNNTPPETLEELQELLVLQERAGAFDAAATVLKAYLDEHPEEFWAEKELCRCLLRLNKQEEASRLLQQMRQKQPDEPEIKALEALQLQTLGDKQAAKEAYLEALERDSSLLWAAYNLAQIATDLKEEELAKKWFDHVITQDPENFAARYQRALLLSQMGQAETFRNELFEVINLNPLMLQPYLLLSEFYLRDGQGERAIEILVHGLQANPLAHPLREALARTFTNLGDGEAAFGVYLELARLRGKVDDFLNLGIAALQKNAGEHAAIAFTKAINLDPKDWRAYYNLAELHRATGDYEGALPLYEKALSCETGDCILNGFALWHLETNTPGADIPKALSLLQQALELNPTYPEAMYNLVLAHAKLGQQVEAQAAYQTLKTTLPENHPLQEALDELKQAITFETNNKGEKDTKS